MAANTIPIFTKTPVFAVVQVATANTALDGTGTTGTLITGATDGTRISKIRVQAIGTTTAGMVRLFLDDGANVRLLREFSILANTISASNPAYAYDLLLENEDAIILPSGYILKASTHNAETFNVYAFGANFS